MKQNGNNFTPFFLVFFHSDPFYSSSPFVIVAPFIFFLFVPLFEYHDPQKSALTG
jgi:hypothetical protein